MPCKNDKRPMRLIDGYKDVYACPACGVIYDAEFDTWDDDPPEYDPPADSPTPSDR